MGTSTRVAGIGREGAPLDQGLRGNFCTFQARLSHPSVHGADVTKTSELGKHELGHKHPWADLTNPSYKWPCLRLELTAYSHEPKAVTGCSWAQRLTRHPHVCQDCWVQPSPPPGQGEAALG